MKVGVIDGACRSLGGHHLTSLQVIRKALPDQQPVFHVHRDADPQITDLLGEVRFDFTTDPYRPTGQRQRKAKRKWLWHAYQLGRRLRGKPVDVLDGSYHRHDLAAIVRQYGHGDHLAIPTTRADMLASLLDVVESVAPDSLPHLHLRFLEYAGEHDRALADRSFSRLATFALSGAPVSLYCETETLRQYLANSFGLESIELCILQPPPPDADAQTQVERPDGFIRVGFLGGARRDKGYFRLPAIIAAAVRQETPETTPSLRFVLQVPGGKEEDWLRAKLADDEALSEDQLELVRGPLDEDRFSALLAGCDILLLPYSNRYTLRHMGSGLLIDARINGIPVVCTPHDTLTEFISAETGKVAETDGDLGRALASIAGDLDRYREAATREEADYRDLWRTNALVSRLRGERGA